MKKGTFVRRSVNRYSKLGLRRKKKQIWRRPNGRDNKMRDKRRGYSAVVSIGYKKSPSKEKILIIRNLEELKKSSSKEVVLGRVGKKNKIEIVKYAQEKNIKILNLNEKKYLKENDREKKKKSIKETPKEDKK
jgi:large subunit ribosomal protein L32e